MTTQNVLFDWSIDPVVVAGLLLAALLYARGVRYARAHGLARHWHSGQAVAFFAGLYGVFIALDSGIDVWASRALWVHMVQHELLVLVVAPLLLLGAPLMPLWRAVPLGMRWASLSWLTQQRWARQMRKLLHALVGAPGGVPGVAWLLFLGNAALWHLPAVYDLALRHSPIHDLEHLLFLGTALLFWVQVIPSPPWRPHLDDRARAFFVGSAGVVLHLCDFVFILAAVPLYPYYAAVPRTPGMPTALTDQAMAGGVMELLNMSVFAVAFGLVLWRSWARPPYAGHGAGDLGQPGAAAAPTAPTGRQ
jgi:putative membrane protein